jgi:hypothetical protein
MRTVNFIVLFSVLCPLWRAWRANARTTLRPSLAWAATAWALWMTAFALDDPTHLWRYLALSLTACAGVSVLGARRPSAGAWNFVVAGLLGVLLIPVARGLGEPRLEAAHLLVLAAGLTVPLLNYLPTRMCYGVLLVAVGCANEWARLAGDGSWWVGWLQEGRLDLALGPWIAWWQLGRRRVASTELDRLWFDFRDRFGVVWGLRAREQFNLAAASSGCPSRLTWFGSQALGSVDDDQAEGVRLLRAVLKRFGPAEEGDIGGPGTIVPGPPFNH